MGKKYRIRIQEEAVDVVASEVKDLNVRSLSGDQFHLIFEDNSYDIELLETDFINRKYTVRINGNRYEAAIETPLDQLISDMGLSLGSNSVTSEIYAPMPGIILEVNVSEGDSVSEGDYLCVLEAMKMENALTAPRDGIIKSVFIQKGETVDKGKLLIEFEEDDQ